MIHRTEDTNDNRGGNNFLSSFRSDVVNSRVTGRYLGNITYDIPTFMAPNWYSDWDPSDDLFGESLIALWTRHLAEAAPDAPTVNVPAALGETLRGLFERGVRGVGLHHFAKQQRDSARLRRQPLPSEHRIVAAFNRRYTRAVGSPRDAARRIADDHLAINFSIKPFLSDLNALINLSNSLEQRRAWLEKSQRGQGVRRRRNRDSSSYTLEGKDTHHLASVLLSVYAECEREVSFERWAYSTWTPIPNRFAPKSDAEMLRALSGLSAVGVGMAAWELIPFSFLVDYFVNVGDFINASLNLFNWSVTGGIRLRRKVSVMHKAQEFLYPGLPRDHTVAYLSSGGLRSTYNLRIPMLALPGLTWSSNYLSPGQLSNIAALGAKRL